MNNIATRLEFDKVLDRIAFYASFSLGKEKVLASRPSFSALIVRRDLNRLRDALRLVREQGSLTFGGLSDVNHALTFAQKGGTLTIEEIVDVGRFMQGMARLRKQFNVIDDEYIYLDDLFESLEYDARILEKINHCFSEQGEVLDRASASLTEIRKSIRNLEHSIDVKTQEFLNKNKSMLSEHVVTYQHGRRTFLVKPSDKYKLEGTLYGESASGQSVYFEPAFLSRMQNELQALFHSEADEIEHICKETSNLIGAEADQLKANLETAAILDALFAKAEWGVRNDAVVATLTKDRLRLVDARHPLIDPKKVVPNTYQLVPPHRMILISGPNTGGKSVSLKTMGLSIVMSLSGCPVCADEAEVMLVDQLFVDIGDQQSIEKSLSSFSAHMETMTRVSEQATPKSIVFLDELGSQTDPMEGESLSMAILDYFRTVGCWVVATTHFSRLKQYGTQHDDILVASVEFDLESLRPTYRYRENIMGESNAFAIAKRLGLKQSIIENAQIYKDESQYETDHLMEILEQKIQENDRINDALVEKQLEIERELEQIEVRNAELERKFNQKMQELKIENEQELEILLNEAEKKLELLNKTNRPDIRKKVVKDLAAMQEKVVIDETIGVGDRVQLKDSNQVGVVEKIEKNVAFVHVGGLTLTIDLKRLIKVAGPAPKKKPKPTRSHSVTARSRFKTELNIVGMRVAEALPVVDKYIDECVLHRVNSFRIIHGHGTGTLRNAVHERLRKNKNVGSFTLGSVGDGGVGVTLVTLKS